MSAIFTYFNTVEFKLTKCKRKKMHVVCFICRASVSPFREPKLILLTEERHHWEMTLGHIGHLGNCFVDGCSGQRGDIFKNQKQNVQCKTNSDHLKTFCTFRLYLFFKTHTIYIKDPTFIQSQEWPNTAQRQGIQSKRTFRNYCTPVENFVR